MTRCGHLSETRIGWKNGEFAKDFLKDFVSETGIYTRRGPKLWTRVPFRHVVLVKDVG